MISSAVHAWEVQGHRGARGLRPENSLPAFEFALQSGVDVLELDVHVSADNVAVVTHDPVISKELCLKADGTRVTETLAIRKLNVAELQKFVCGKLGHPRFPDQILQPARIPTLAELFRFVKGSALPAAKRVQFNIETKITPGAPEDTLAPKPLVELILKTAREAGMLERIRLQSFDDRTLLVAHKLAPKIPRILLTAENHIDYVHAAKRAHAQAVSPHYDWILKDDVIALHKAGLKVVPWTANEDAVWKKLVDFGVDGIITDYPDRLIQFRSRAKPR